MNTWILPFVILVAGIAIIALKKASKKQSVTFPYKSREKLFSKAERSFLGVLDTVLGEQYRVFAKVRIADILNVSNGVTPSERQSAFNRISRKHVDFLITRKDDLSFVGVIELDDKSHKAPKRQDRDEFIDKAFNAAGIPILHIKARAGYSQEQIATEITDAFQVETQRDNTPPVEAEIGPLSSELKLCPKCGGELLKRVAQKGKNKGKNFWGCSNFPKCRFVMKRE